MNMDLGMGISVQTCRYGNGCTYYREPMGDLYQLVLVKSKIAVMRSRVEQTLKQKICYYRKGNMTTMQEILEDCFLKKRNVQIAW